MRALIGLLLILSACTPRPHPGILKTSAQIVEAGKKGDQTFTNLRELTALGPRLSGSEGADKAIHWARRKMESYGFDRVYLQPMQAPKWTRGGTELASVRGLEKPVALKVAAIGGSSGTPGVEATVVEVQGLDEVDKLGDAVKGKIVFYNRALDPAQGDFEAYGNAVDQRHAGPAAAAKQGAVAVLVRSLSSLPDDDHPHTGNLNYREEKPIPAAALSTKSANTLSALLKKNPGLRVHLQLSAQNHPPVPSFNVIGELRGRDIPGEIVVVGGHLDSWDLGPGAHDDGAGVVQSIEVLRCLKTFRPRRTVRAVLFMSEEFGGIGGKEYAKQAAARKEKHIAGLESDAGASPPAGFSVDSNHHVFRTVQSWTPYFPAGLGKFKAGHSGTDVAPLDALGAATFGLSHPDHGTHYFEVHHSALDQIGTVNPDDLRAGAAAMTLFTYLAAELGFE